MPIPGAQFVLEAKSELQKSTWLSRQEVIGSTFLICILVVLMAIYVASIDFVLAIILGALLGR